MKKIALFGTGLMGEPMAHRLLEAGYPLVVCNRTPSKTEALRVRGAAVAGTPKEALERADIYITMLADYPATADFLLTESRDYFNGKTFIQMGTIMPSESLKLNAWVEDAGGEYLEAPVLGSIPQVKGGTLFILVGATEEQFIKWEPLLKTFGDKRIHMGEVGKAAAAKLALNQLIASLTAAFSMSLGYLRQTGVEVEKFMGILRDSALYAPTFDKKFERMMKRDFARPNFPAKHLLKDVDLILEELGKTGIAAAPLKGVKEILLKAMELGEADQDYSALYNAVHPR
jgi:3-hydroxyisobutyrate dehydrogenase